MAQYRRLEVVIAGDPRGFTRALSTSNRGLGGFGTKLAHGAGIMARWGAAAVAAGGALAVAFAGKTMWDAIKNLAELDRLERQTEAVLRSTGGAAGVTAGHVSELAESLEALSSVDNKVIQDGANVLLTFTNIKNAVGEGNDIFDRAAGAALDMSVALGTDLQGAVTMVGKALQDPLRGITALRRVGVNFTDEQRDMIAAMLEAGDTLGAQKLILAELNTEFAGSAEALGESLTGRVELLKDNFEDLMMDAIEPLIPHLEKLVEWGATALPKAFDAVGRAVDWVKDRWAVWAPVVTGALSDAQGSVQGFWDKIVEAFDVVRQWVDANRGKFEEWGAKLSEIFGHVREIVSDVFGWISSFWNEWGDEVLTYLGEVFGNVLGTIEGVLGVIRNVFNAWEALFTGDWEGLAESIKNVWANAWDVIHNVLDNALGPIDETVGNMVRSVLQSFEVLVNGAIDFINALIAKWNSLPAILKPGNLETIGSLGHVNFVGANPFSSTGSALSGGGYGGGIQAGTAAPTVVRMEVDGRVLGEAALSHMYRTQQRSGPLGFLAGT